MHFPTVMLGGEAVAELVNDLHDGQADPEVEDGPPVEEALNVGQHVVERLPLAGDQHDGGEHRREAERHEGAGEDPAEVGIHPRQEPLGVDDRDLDEEDVGQECPDFSPAILLAAADQDLGLFATVDLDDPRFVKLSDKPGQVFNRNRLRPVFALERLLHFLKRQLAVELLKQEVFLDFEAEVLERERVFDHVVRHPLVELGLDDQVGTEPDLEMFGGLPEGQGGGQSGSSAH